MLAVGYDDSGDQPHYIVKNSWGGSWGEKVGLAPLQGWGRRCVGQRCIGQLGGLRKGAERCMEHSTLNQAPLTLIPTPLPPCQGYFRLAAKSSDPRGACGVLTKASYPTKKDSTNPEVPSFCGYFGWTECPVHSSCTCNWSFFGLFCLNWGCAAEGAPVAEL